MILPHRIDAFSNLGRRLHSIEERDRAELFRKASDRNAWFTAKQCDLAWEGILKFLDKSALKEWTTPYSLAPAQPKEIGVVMAGNIPMVGFHDFLTVLVSGHHLRAKFSSQDSVLMTYITDELIRIEPRFREMIHLQDRMNGVDAVIATGGDNTARYFEYYFRDIPHVIRKNRSSCAIITGDESVSELTLLGIDVFSYYGLGCRNVSKLLVPPNYDFSPLLRAWEGYSDVANHHKYANNYDYNKSILLVNCVPFLDNGSVMLSENKSMVSPISVVYHEAWDTLDDLARYLKHAADKIQCIASSHGWYPGSVPFGTTQQPGLTDYADGVNTLEFLSKL